MDLHCGDIYYADLIQVDRKLGGIRPVLIIHSVEDTVTVAAITTNRASQRLETDIDVYSESCDLANGSVALMGQLWQINRNQLKGKLGEADRCVIDIVNDIARRTFN